MSLFSPLKLAASAALSAVKGSTSIKVYLLLAIIVSGLVGGLWLYVSGLQGSVADLESTTKSQGDAIRQYKADVSALSLDRDEVLRQRDSEREKTKNLSHEVAINVQKLQQAMDKADKFKAEMDELQRNDKCAHAPLPAGVNRMLNEDARAFNDQYRGDESAPNPGQATQSDDVPAARRP